MADVKWWLMALAFLLGLAITAVLMIRRVTREVPISDSFARRGPGVDGAAVDGGTESGSVSGAAKFAGDKAGGDKAGGDKADTEPATTKMPAAEGAVTGKMPAAGAAVGGVAAAKFVGGKSDSDSDSDTVSTEIDAPYGVGSARVGTGGSGPSGWTVKGNEESMLYHTPESPSYQRTIAEVWFSDEETAVAAGFARWDSGKSQRPRK